MMDLFFILTVPIPPSWLCYGTIVLARCYHWEKLSKWFMGSLLLLKIACEFIIILKYFTKENNTFKKIHEKKLNIICHWKIQLKAIFQDHSIPVRLLKWKRLTILCVGENVEELGENVEESYTHTLLMM